MKIREERGGENKKTIFSPKSTSSSVCLSVYASNLSRCLSITLYRSSFLQHHLRCLSRRERAPHEAADLLPVQLCWERRTSRHLCEKIESGHIRGLIPTEEGERVSLPFPQLFHSVLSTICLSLSLSTTLYVLSWLYLLPQPSFPPQYLSLSVCYSYASLRLLPRTACISLSLSLHVCISLRPPFTFDTNATSSRVPPLARTSVLQSHLEPNAIETQTPSQHQSSHLRNCQICRRGRVFRYLRLVAPRRDPHSLSRQHEPYFLFCAKVFFLEKKKIRTRPLLCYRLRERLRR